MTSAISAASPSPASWNVLREGRSGELMAVVDFSATGRSVATFAELVTLLGTGETVWETAPPPFGREAGMTGADHVARWLDDLRADGRPVRAVLGFCTGAVYAAALAEGIAGRQPNPPAVVLLDPVLSDRELLYQQYERLVGGRLSAVLSQDEAGRAREAGRRAVAEAAGELDLAGRLSALLREYGGAALTRAGLDARRSAELVDTFTAYLCYLAAAAEFDPTPVWSTATAVSSNTPDSGLNLLSEERRAALVGREIRLAVCYPDLLRSDEVARTVAAVLAS